jgi:LuxR family transcriptional regulator, maltose regulon positive regulatory protein
VSEIKLSADLPASRETWPGAVAIPVRSGLCQCIRNNGFNMTAARTSINKITSPSVSGIYPRTRLFTCMDDALARQVVWVRGPAGSGKSTLVASYLGSRNLPHVWYQVDEGDSDIGTLFYYLGLAARKAAPDDEQPLPLLTKDYQESALLFSRRYFENLFARLTPPFVLVFDDYQEVGAASQFHAVIQSALEELPHGLKVIVTSRGDPPPSLARLRARGRMGFISWEELRLQPAEAQGIMQLHDESDLNGESVRQLLEKTSGWVAGVVLMLERGNAIGIPATMAEQAPDVIFDYFAGELFAKASTAIQDFFLKTAFMAKMTPQIAYRITGNHAAGPILAELHARNLFIEKYSGNELTYQYHPLFREFLVKKANDVFPGRFIVQLQKISAELLLEDGQVEHAAELFIAAQDWPGIGDLIRGHAHVLITQGRSSTLEAWISQVPREVLDETPWLQYWLGVCRFIDHVHEARGLFESSLELFRSAQDAAGIYLAWSGIANCFRRTMENWRALEHWIAVLDEIMVEYPAFPSPQVEIRLSISMYTSLVLLQTDHRRIAEWEKRLLALLDNNPNIILRVMAVYAMLHHQLWCGNYAKMRLLLDSVGTAMAHENVPPMATVMVKSMEAFYYWVTAQGEQCRRAVSEGLAVANSSGIQFLNSRMRICELQAALIEVDAALLDKCQAELASYQPRDNNLNEANYYFCSALLALLRDDVARAAGCIEAAAAPAMKVGSYFHECLWYLGKALVLFASSNSDEALAQVAGAVGLSRQIKSRNLEFMGLLIKAWFLLRLEDEENCLSMLRRAMALGREHDYLNCMWWDPRMVAPLCLKALEEGIEVEYVRRLVRQRRLVPDKIPLDCDNWPWPVRVTTLGEFSISVDGQPLQFSGKVQKKPIEMLKALIALGGAEKSEGQIADFLWPEADGDTAKNSCKITLHRLRQMIGRDDAIQVRKGKLVIDPRLVWADVSAFEQLLAAAQLKGETGDEGDAVRLTGKALALYYGHFLPGDGDKVWAAAPRARLKNRFVLNIVVLGNLYQQVGERKKALDWYLRGLEVEPHAEEFYQNLMQCHIASGLHAEAITAFRDCRLALAELGLAPSSRTQAIYKTALQE